MNIIRLYNDDVESPTRDRTVSGDDTRAGPLFYNNHIIPRADRDLNPDRYQYNNCSNNNNKHKSILRVRSRIAFMFTYVLFDLLYGIDLD